MTDHIDKILSAAVASAITQMGEISVGRLIHTAADGTTTRVLGDRCTITAPRTRLVYRIDGVDLDTLHR